MPFFCLPSSTKHQAFAPSGPMLFLNKSKSVKVEFSLRPSAKAWQEKSGPWVQLLNWSNSESSQFSLLKISPAEGWRMSIRSIKHQTLLNTIWCFGHVNSHLFVFGSDSNLDRYWSSPTHQLALTMRSPFWPSRILKVFRDLASARYSARALQGESNPVWKSCSDCSASKLWRRGNIPQRRRKTMKSML